MIYIQVLSTITKLIDKQKQSRYRFDIDNNDRIIVVD